MGRTACTEPQCLCFPLTHFCAVLLNRFLGGVEITSVNILCRPPAVLNTKSAPFQSFLLQAQYLYTEQSSHTPVSSSSEHKYPTSNPNSTDRKVFGLQSTQLLPSRVACIMKRSDNDQRGNGN